LRCAIRVAACATPSNAHGRSSPSALTRSRSTRPGEHHIPGIGVGFIPAVLDRSLIDEVLAISDQHAFSAARRLAHEEGILAGASSGAAIHAALTIAARDQADGQLIVALLADTGERYITTPLFPDPHYQPRLNQVIRAGEPRPRCARSCWRAVRVAMGRRDCDRVERCSFEECELRRGPRRRSLRPPVRVSRRRRRCQKSRSRGLSRTIRRRRRSRSRR